MKKLIIFTFLLIFSLFSPYISYAESENSSNKNGEVNTNELLAHIVKKDTTIYVNIDDLSDSMQAEDYIDTLLYVKDQETLDNRIYYLLSSDPDNEDSDVGWVESDKLELQPFISIDEKEKRLYIKGSGAAYHQPWGGNADLAFNLEEYKDRKFDINATKEVGEETWYRGVMDKTTIWIQAADLTSNKDNTEYEKEEEKEESISDEPEMKTEDEPKADDTDDSIEEDKSDMMLYIEGSGAASYHQPGHSDEDLAFELESYKSQKFNINATKEIDGEVWYRGLLNETEVWIQSINLISDKDNPENGKTERKEELKTNETTVDAADEQNGVDSDENKEQDDDNGNDEKTVKSDRSKAKAASVNKRSIQLFAVATKEIKTSRLGHIRSSKVKIYQTIGNESTATKAGSKYTDSVYYIKKQATAGSQVYYLISTQASSTTGVVGWVKSKDLSTHSHTGVDNKSKVFYIKGTGKAYDTAWGGSKNLIYNLSQHKNAVFNVHKTEKVGNNTWYRGTLKGKTVWIHSSYLSNMKESKTSKLGHIRSSKVKIYQTIGNESTAKKAGSKYINSVYYIKRQATAGSQVYYLISTRASSTAGIVGWVKSKDLSTHSHTGVDNKSKVFYVKGTGKAYDTAWGGSKNLTYNLSQLKNETFNVHKTEKVGNNTWYRGTLKGKTVWIHSSYLDTVKESKTSRLGHIRSSKVKIYQTVGNESTAITAGSKYTHSVYYIKKQASAGSQIYYLISKEASSSNGVVGWVKSQDLSTHSHVGVDKKSKTFYVKGTGKAYDTAWGGNKNLIYNLSQYKSKIFNVHLTEKVGNNTWYRGVLDGKTVWIHESYVVPASGAVKTSTKYNITLKRMADIQMKVTPQTDKRYQLWIREDALNVAGGKGTVKGNNWNLRRGPGANYLSGGKVNQGTVLTLKSSSKGSDGYTWYYVRDTSGWVIPDINDLTYYLNAANFTDNLRDSLQFLNLSERANVNIAEVNNKILNGKGILAGKAQSFADGARKYGVNEIYLISHALLETGNGTSKLATGIKYKGKTVYNMYGIGAKDSCPEKCGAEYAYNAGWFTPEAAVKGGAEFVGKKYLGVGQNTLYKMRWNPSFAAANGYASHQYATDIGWASKQTRRMYELYSLIDGYHIVLDIPQYK